MERCPSCDARLEGTGRVCGNCGTPLSRSIDEPERRKPARFRPSTTIVRAAFESGPDLANRFLPGTVLSDRYRLLGLVGRGGIGEVYRADDLRLGQAVALKFLSQDPDLHASARRRLLNEVKLARQIAHPNVCRVYDVGDVDGQQFISMEYIDGEDLASLLRRIGRLPRDKATQIARQICLGLAAAHDQGILHRDLKPSNVMIDGRGRARITDFGLAAPSHEIDSSDAMSGTPAYMAPEQLAGDAVTIKSDLYAVGLVLYELFTGKHPFDADTPSELVRLRRDSLPTSPAAHLRGFDPGIERIILACLQRDPRERPSSARGIAAALPGSDPLQEAIAAGDTPSPGLVAEGTSPLGLRPVAVWAGLASAFVGLALVAGIAAPSRFLSQAPLDKPLGYLIERAREVVRACVGNGRENYEAYGYQLAPQHAPSLGQDDVIFWYRQGPRPLVPTHSVVTDDDPTIRTTGSTRVWLDAQGRLRLLESFPAWDSTGDIVDPNAAWNELFLQAGLDRSAFEQVAPERTPPGYADARAAWSGTPPGTRAAPPRVEAAALDGRPVYFDATGGSDRSPAKDRDVWSRINAAASSVLLVPVLIVAGFLARRNLLAGRGDRKGAFRLATFMFALWLIFGTLSANHYMDAVELEIVFRILSRACLSFGLFWILYMALEPYARRTWPGMLVSWVRVLDGRLRDPLVGWHLLLGVICGCAAALIEHASVAAMRFVGSAASDPGAIAFQLRPLASFRFAIAGTVTLLDFSVTTSLQTLVILLVLRVIVRRQVPAVIALYLVLLLVFAGSMVSLPGHAVIVALFLALLLRFGLLALMSGLFVFALLGNYAIDLDPASPFAPTSYLAFSLAAVLAAYGAHGAWNRGTVRRGSRPSTVG